MSSSHGRSSSHAAPRPTTASNSQRPSSQQRERPVSSSGTIHGASPASVPRKRRSDHGVPEDAKRRRQDAGVLSADELLKPSIVVRAHPPNPLSRPCTLFPMMLLPRELLSLSYLDLSSPSGDLPSSRHFQSHIRILDLEGRLGSNILIARLPSSSTGSSAGFSSASSLFAIEREDTGLYVLCKLGSWVDINKLGEHATAVCQQRMPATATALAAGKAEEPALITPQVYKERGKKRLAIAELQSIVRRRPASQVVADPAAAASQTDDMPSPCLEMAEDPKSTSETPTDSKETSNDLPARPPSQVVQPDKATSLKPTALPTPPASDATKRSSTEPTLPVDVEPTGPPTAEDIFQNIRNQYFEALYHSLGSLAYFAKGPLSRARAAFHLDCDSNLEMDELIDFLKSIILTSATIDKKYRETVPDLVSHLRTLGEISDHTETKRKSKKPKKIKLGSSGLYTDEDVHVRKWWAANKPSPRDDEVFPRPEEVKYTISCLRTRETQLQMVLILEIMALETMRPIGDAGESQLPGMGGEMAAATPAKKEAPKKRNKHNLPLLIDVHADRLCIWQSTTSDDVRALAESQARPAGEVNTTKTAHSDPLKEFCIDIIVPFFSPRLPLVCDSLNRKLGGPVISASGSRSKTAHGSTKSPSDAKSREKSSSSSKLHSRSKPGAAAKRSSASTDKTRSLERVLSSERLRRSVSRGPNDAIAQMRSATAAPIPGLKREMSEPALASIPRRSSSTSLKERPSNTLSRSSSDLVSSSAGRSEELRARKKALVDAELQEAISALKKPNRELAGKATVEAAEKRLFGVQNQRRPKKQPPRPSPGEKVQVKATPATNRFRDVFASTTTTMDFQGHDHRGHGDMHMHGSYSQNYQEQYRMPVNRELLFPGRSQHQVYQAHQVDYLPSSPRIMGTPSAGRVQATPMRTSISVPDSVIKPAPITSAPFEATSTTTTATTTTTTTMTATGTSKFSMARVSRLETFPEEEDSVPMSSPVAARRVAPQAVSTGSGASINAFRRLGDNKAAFLENDAIPASSPLQAYSQPSATVMVATENREALLSTSTQRHSALFETPTKVRSVTMEDSAAMKRVMATPLLATPLLATPRVGRSLAPSTTTMGGGNSVQSLYAQMGWDDEIDDLA
ncbi:hypothetical protein Sste5346_006849 [Sporothrix stenoceras]|uniref:DNA replication regulator Sld3 C-terminal domain-containing protein n=1 Tax=Sporothrix stenoceras TaxID=5173 RepID=A0ABR3YXY5_9PEZI